MSEKREYIYLFVLLLLCVWMAYYRGKSDGDLIPEPTKKVESDTTRRFAPPPVEIAPLQPFKVELPRMLFVERTDTAYIDRVKVDSVEVEVQMEAKTYRDSTFEARVSGPTIGGRGPTLDYCHTYHSTMTITNTEQPRKWWALSASAGALYAQSPDLWAGLTIERHAGRWSYGGSVGYTLSGHPYAEVRGGWRIFGGNK
uniref:DUF6808 domain-containing protein n=1 Tax=Alistipes sp. TaxID=1872444 RepID=UPI004055BDA8